MMGRHKKTYPECFKWAVAMRVKSGVPRERVANELGLTYAQVQWWCHKFGIKVYSRSVMTKEVGGEAESLWRDGMSVSKMALELHVNEKTLRNHICKHRDRFPYRKKRKNAKARMAQGEGQDPQRQEVHDVRGGGRPLWDDDLLGWPGKADDVQVQEAPDDQVLA